MSTIEQEPKTEQKLPLDSLEIKGYRCFKELTIPKLARVNLITGKNNVGKTSLLEAVQIWARRGSPGVLWDVLSTRETGLTSANAREYPDLWHEIVRMFHGVYPVHDWLSDNEIAPIAEIGPTVGAERVKFSIARPNPSTDVPLGMRVAIGKSTAFTSSSTYALKRIVGSEREVWENPTAPPCICVNCRIGIYDVSGALWDAISLTPGKDDVIAGLKLINAEIEDAALLGDIGVGMGRLLNVRLKGDFTRHPLSEFGDGIKRWFDVLIGITNTSHGLVLLDEIENGLHYSVHAEVWRTIFDLANRLNVQIFATTHSWECIQAFQEALWSSEENDGELIRLEQKNDTIVPTVFDKRSVKVIAEDWIEVR